MTCDVGPVCSKSKLRTMEPARLPEGTLGCVPCCPVGGVPRPRWQHPSPLLNHSSTRKWEHSFGGFLLFLLVPSFLISIFLFRFQFQILKVV